MDSLTGAAIAAVVAWLSIVAAAFLPIPPMAVQRLRWVGAASIALVGLALVGVAVPTTLPGAVLVVGGVLSFLWPKRGTAAVGGPGDAGVQQG